MPWVIAVIFLLSYEFWAIHTNRKTLSRMLYDANARWPFLAPLIGFIIGGLMVHFFWHWCPGGGHGRG